ncbi:MAG: tyrosine-type recombinase/integrase [Oscillospiraceae bacterium]|nr:tyrosine-type recombinase/integrase [Oscillospiraceae bacterium]
MHEIFCESNGLAYRRYLISQELSRLTVKKYISDVERLFAFLNKRTAEPEDVMAYKSYLISRYKSSAVNSYLISANRYFRWLGREDLCLNLMRRQKTYFSSGEMSVTDYHAMLEHTRLSYRDRKWYLIMRCLGGLGIRVGELRFITREAAAAGYAEIFFKSKLRTILIPDELRALLLTYCEESGITSGSLFRNKQRTAPVDPSVVWRNLKRIAADSGVNKAEVYPHNFRHMFARTYMSVYNNIVDLADILGHSSIETTRIYTRTSREAQRKKLDKLGL